MEQGKDILQFVEVPFSNLIMATTANTYYKEHVDMKEKEDKAVFEDIHFRYNVFVLINQHIRTLLN